MFQEQTCKSFFYKCFIIRYPQKACYQDWTCFLGHIGEYFVGDLLSLLKNRVTHDVSCILDEISNGGLKQTYECYQCFHDVKSALYTVISNYHKVRVLLKVINSKLNLIHGSIRKRTRNRQKSVFHRKFLIIYIVSVSLRFGACYITSQ